MSQVKTFVGQILHRPNDFSAAVMKRSERGYSNWFARMRGKQQSHGLMEWTKEKVVRRCTYLSDCHFELALNQRPKHDHRILIRPIILPHRTRDHTHFFETKLFPEMACGRIFRKHQIEDYAAVAELLGVPQHGGTQQPAQALVAPVGCNDEAGVRHLPCAPRPVRLEVERPAHGRRTGTIRHIGRHGTLAAKPIVHEVILIRKSVVRVGRPLFDNDSIEVS